MITKILPQIEALVRTAGQRICSAHPDDDSIHKKEGIANFCTDYDVAIQKFLIEGLEELLPGAAFFGEEDTEKASTEHIGEYTFYIDPIDGTTNFMFGYNHSCVSVGLAHHGKMIAGFIYNPYVDEMFQAVLGEGSFLNGRKLFVEDKPIAEGIVSFGCARYNENEGDVDRLFEVIKRLYLNSLSVRNGGSSALDLCRVAAGRNAAYLELKLNPYDYAAASLIIEEAGGVITQADGSPITLDKPCSIVGGTKKANMEIRETLAAVMHKQRGISF